MTWLEDAKKLGIKAPDTNNLLIRIPLRPVSQQSNGDTKRNFVSAVKDACAEYSYLVTSDVRVEVTWHVHEQERYETDRSPDIDNILKPLLDGLCGPNGILIDDNQIQNICCSWIDWERREQEVVVEIEFVDEEWVPKGHFQFVQFSNGLCYPVPTYLPRELQLGKV